VDLVADGERTWHLSAPAATLPGHQSRFQLEGPVLGGGQWPDDGEDLVFHTTELWVDPEMHEIDTDAPVELESPYRNASAVGMRSDWAERSMQLLHNVKTSYEQSR
jgi:LPS export ABC transporter protein LptC